MQPVLSQDILLSPVSNGYVAYDPKRDTLHRLNPIAALIVECCDGKRSLHEIQELLAPIIPAGKESCIAEWIRSAIAVGLLSDSMLSSEEKRELSSDELAKIASKLRDHGKVKTALLCQKQAAKLAPKEASKWYHLGELAHINGKRALARKAYRRYLELEPDDAEVRHLLVALEDQRAPDRVPDDCIRHLYSRFSSYYEQNVYEELGSQAPKELLALVEKHDPSGRPLSVLDLGCGTGIFGDAIAHRKAHLVGVDLSEEMLELARKRGIYDSLHASEIVQWLQGCQETFDVIVACDSLIYFGDLSQIVAPASQLLREGGTVVFSVEKADHDDYCLTDSGRFVHGRRHILETARQASMEVTCLKEEFLRMEYGEQVIGYYVAMSPQPAAHSSDQCDASPSTLGQVR